MKASLSFREERSPLIKMKFPVSLAGFQLNSGIVLGDNQDLAIQIGTRIQEACPSLRISYHPNNSSHPVCVVLKAGLGPWGPPCLSAVSVLAQLRLSKSFTAPSLTLHIKPQLGDFSLWKDIKLAGSPSLSPSHSKMLGSPLPLSKITCTSAGRHGHDVATATVSAFSSSAPTTTDENMLTAFHDRDLHRRPHHSTIHDAHSVTPLKLEKSSLFTPVPHRRTNSQDRHNANQSGTDNWVNDFVKIENFNQNSRRRPSFDSSFKGSPEVGSPVSVSVGGGSLIADHETETACYKNGASDPVSCQLGVKECMKDWTLLTRSSLSLGNQAAIDIRWGVRLYSEMMQGWENNLTPVKLPYLYLQKISLVSYNSVLKTRHHADQYERGNLEFIERDEQIGELSPVTALCGSTKRQLQLLYTENQVLKKAMEDMKLHFEQRSNGKTRRAGDTDSINGKPLDHAGKWGWKQGKYSVSKDKQNDSNAVSERNDHITNGLDAPKKLNMFGLIGKRKS